ncbi:MAG TPA: glutamate ABC transporter substrate-binding protein [Solirubrobacteraceae bacterium]|nr:glutamate ABC transporter substrate-binding protein [Solirubrobacteraceae bacterium]
MRATIRAALMVALGAVLLAGCGSSSDRPQRMALAALGVSGTLPAPSASTTIARSCGDVTASLRRPTAMPAPGAMPQGSFMQRIQRRGYLVAGVDQNTLLFAYFNPLDSPPQLEGFEIDMLHRLAKAIFGDPNRIKFRAITTDERIDAVRSGKVDVVADAMTITCARRQQVDFSTVYYDAGQKILVPSNSTARSAADLAGKRVCVTKGSTSYSTLRQLYPTVIPYTVPQRTDCLVKMQQGLVDAVTSDDAILLGFKAQDPNTKIVGPRFADEPYGIAIRQDHPEFVRFVNGVLAQMRADGTWQSIYTRWLGKLSPSTPPPPAAHYDG